MPEYTCSNDMTGPIIVQQGCDMPNNIKAKRKKIYPNSEAITGPVIVLRTYGPLQATQIMTESTYNKSVTG